MKSKVLTALPAFVATYLGVALYIAVDDDRIALTISLVVVLSVVGGVCLRIGRRSIAAHPRRGAVLISGFILTLIAVGAVLVALVLWVGLRLPEWIAGSEASEEIKEIAKVLLGAATAFVAVVFTDDLDKADGELWPSTKTKDAFEKAFDGRFDGGSAPYDAAFEERVRARPGNKTINGWGFVDRIRRAWIIESALK
jgi:hypothetical protein